MTVSKNISKAGRLESHLRARIRPLAQISVDESVERSSQVVGKGLASVKTKDGYVICLACNVLHRTEPTRLLERMLYRAHVVHVDTCGSLSYRMISFIHFHVLSMLAQKTTTVVCCIVVDNITWLASKYKGPLVLFSIFFRPVKPVMISSNWQKCCRIL